MFCAEGLFYGKLMCICRSKGQKLVHAMDSSKICEVSFLC